MKTFKNIIEETIINEGFENYEGVVAKQLGLEFASTFKNSPFYPGFEIRRDSKNDTLKIDILSKANIKQAMSKAKERLDKINKKRSAPFEIKQTKNGFILK